MKHFTIAEFCRSSTADKYGIDNRCKMEHVENIQNLVDNVLDPLREKWGKPLLVNSGFRSPELNKIVGGQPTSQHMKGEAADITTGNKEDNREIFELIQEMQLPFDQLIDENDFSWIHVSFRDGRNRGQILKI